MGSQILHSRKSQLNLLVEVCSRDAAAELTSRQPCVPACNAILSVVERDGVLLRCDGQVALQIESPGSPVQVRFDDDGQRYVFSATSHGRVCRNLPSGEAASLLKLSLPVTIEPARKRRHARLSFDGMQEFYGVFTHVVDSGRRFRARLTGASEGGLSAQVATSEISHLRPGDLFWFSVESKGEVEVATVAVRLVHVRPVKNSDKLVMGWAFQPTEDAFRVSDCISQLAELASSSRQGG